MSAYGIGNREMLAKARAGWGDEARAKRAEPRAIDSPDLMAEAFCAKLAVLAVEVAKPPPQEETP